MATTTHEAAHIATIFEQIKARQGHAAIDFGPNGALTLQCTKPDYCDSETWGRGAVPQPWADWARLVEC